MWHRSHEVGHMETSGLALTHAAGVNWASPELTGAFCGTGVLRGGPGRSLGLEARLHLQSHADCILKPTDKLSSGPDQGSVNSGVGSQSESDCLCQVTWPAAP